jgi:hypothetical protein
MRSSCSGNSPANKIAISHVPLYENPSKKLCEPLRKTLRTSALKKTSYSNTHEFDITHQPVEHRTTFSTSNKKK